MMVSVFHEVTSFFASVGSVLADPTQLKGMVSYFLVPLGALTVSWLIQHSVIEKVGAGVDLFVFLAALDLGFLADPDGFHGRLQPQVVHPTLVAFFIWSLIWVLLAAKVERAIHTHTRGAGAVYPIKRVVLCWFVALVSISLHLYLTIGGSSHG